MMSNVAAGTDVRRIGFRVLAGAETDTTTANGRLVFGVFASLAEFERELIAERTRAGRAGGRPRKMDQAMLRIAMSAMANHETDVQALAQWVADKIDALTRTAA